MTVAAAALTPIAENIYGIDAPCEPGVDVRAVLICGSTHAVLLDTLARPSDLQSARDIIESWGRPLWIVNSHADWDHWWGNEAFPDAPIIASRRTHERQVREGKRTLMSKQRKEPVRYDDVVLRPATIRFSGELDLDLGDMQVQLRPLPGHTADSIVAYIPERRLLFAADAAEDPIPLVNDQSIDTWSTRLLQWAEQARVVVPSHGEIGGPELLRRNAAYLEGLQREPQRDVPELATADSFYKRAHQRNRRRAASL